MNTQRINSGNGHWYKLDGEKVDGVTTVLGNGIPKPALVGWAAKSIAEYVGERLDIDPDTNSVRADNLVRALAKIGEKNRYNKWPNDGTPSRLAIIETLKGVHWEDRDQAARRGTEVHGYADKLAHGEEVTVPDELLGHVDSYLKFLDDWDVEALIVEAVVGHRAHRWMGTLDLIARLNDGHVWLLDLKTSRSGIYGETALQMAAYRHAEFYIDPDGNEQPMPAVDRVGAIWCRADGYDLIPVDAGPETYRLFRYAQQIAKFTTTTAKELVLPALQPTEKVTAA